MGPKGFALADGFALRPPIPQPAHTTDVTVNASPERHIMSGV